MLLFTGLEKLFRRRGAEPPHFRSDASFTVEIEADETIEGIDDVLNDVDVDDGEDFDRDSVSPRARALREFWERLERFGDNASGTVFGIEYEAYSGERTLRRIRLHRLYRDDALVYLRAFCFERRAPRTFRLDRILAVFDMDGVVHEDVPGFLTSLGVDLDEQDTVTGPPDVAWEKPGMAARRAARDGLRLLVALARSDGFLHEEELEVVKRYIVERAEHENVFAADEDLAALDGYLRRQYPSDEVVLRCLRAVEKEPPDLQRLFIRHAISLADADGVQHEGEFGMLMDIQQRLGA